MPIRVKKETLMQEDEHEDEIMQVEDTHYSSRVHGIDGNNESDEEEDEIVREMDVFLSPELARHLHLVQFPLQQFPSGQHNQLEQSLPIAARYKPQHNMLELDQKIPTSYIEQQGMTFLDQRTYTSNTVPVLTHQALGKVVKDDENDDDETNLSFHLTPLHHITQMRPSFAHIDENDPNNTTLEEEQAAAASLNQDQTKKDTRKPLMFQKKESERAAMARKSSYAFKKTSEEGEEWVPLQVLGEDLDAEEEEAYGAEMLLLRGQVACPVQSRGQSVLDVSGGKDDADDDAMNDGDDAAAPNKKPTLSLANYVRSLNYLSSNAGTYDRGPVSASSTNGPDGASIKDDDDDGEKGPNTKYLVDWKQTGWDEKAALDLPTIVGHLTTLLCGGWPIPFSILKESLPPTVSEKDILVALSSCAVMVGGNFTIQSRLLQLPKSVTKARTFMLLLLQSMGIIHRSRLDRALGIKKTNTGNVNSVKREEGREEEEENIVVADEHLTDESVFMLLEQMAQKTPAGWVLRVEEDPRFLIKYPDNTELHMQYWGRQMLRFQDYLQRYATASTAV